MMRVLPDCMTSLIGICELTRVQGGTDQKPVMLRV
jgi:hypothetical protein